MPVNKVWFIKCYFIYIYIKEYIFKYIQSLKTAKWTIATVLVHNKSSQNVPFWHVAYFELKAIKSRRLKGNLSPPLTPLKNLRRVSPSIRVMTRDKFDLSDPSVWQGKHLIPKHLLSFLSKKELLVNCPLHLWSPRPLSRSLARDSIYTSLYLSVFESLMFVEFSYI